jgi:hypothetical protein
MQKMTERPPSMAALVLRAMNCSEKLVSIGYLWRLLGVVEWCVVQYPQLAGCTYLVSLLQDDTALAVANDNPVNLGVLQLLNADLAGESTVGLVEDVLGSNADLGVGQAAGESEVEGGGRDDDLGGRVELGGVEVVHDAGDALSNTVPVILVNCVPLYVEIPWLPRWRGNPLRDRGVVWS